MIEEWTESTILMDMNKTKQQDVWMDLDIIYLSKLLVTIHIFKIYQKQLAIDKLGPAVWNYTANYYMGRLSINRFDK